MLWWFDRERKIGLAFNVLLSELNYKHLDREITLIKYRQNIKEADLATQHIPSSTFGINWDFSHSSFMLDVATTYFNMYTEMSLDKIKLIIFLFADSQFLNTFSRLILNKNYHQSHILRCTYYFHYNTFHFYDGFCQILSFL